MIDLEKLEQIVNIISMGDVAFAETLLNKPGGRSFLESLVLVVMCRLSHDLPDKEEYS
ncbi:MAG: hypothetical protein ACR2KZ_19205 [Segetibacter sp.]